MKHFWKSEIIIKKHFWKSELDFLPPPFPSPTASQCADVARAANFASAAFLRGLHPVRQAHAADKMHPASGRRKPNSPSLGFASLFPRCAHFNTPLAAMSSSAQTIFAGCEANRSMRPSSLSGEVGEAVIPYNSCSRKRKWRGVL